MILIKTHQLVKSYGIGEQTVHALDGVSVNIDQGEFVAIVGASGSGKSTFMNMIGCLDQPSSGSYDLGGEDVASMTSDELADLRNRRIGFIFQQFNLLARTSALENVALPLLYARMGPLAGLSKEQRYEHAKQRLEQVGLGERLQNTPSQLSGGQQQRVAAVRALMGSPRLLIADEPTSALDDDNQMEFIDLLLDTAQQQNASVVMVSHNARLASRFHQVFQMRAGGSA